MEPNKERKRRFIQLGLFVLTFVCTTIAGAEWRYNKSFYGDEPLLFSHLLGGLSFSLSFLAILTFHEFGHYFTAKYHSVKVSLPYYIPLWLGFLPFGFPSVGTMGAVIRIREKIQSRKLYFDIGVAGPLAGFVVAVLVIVYGFYNLPPLDYIFEIHPEYAKHGRDYAEEAFKNKNGLVLRFGPNLLFWILENVLPIDKSLLPHPNEVIHYPYFLAGYLALFFTSLNLFPIGQLDGGHVLYGVLGAKTHRIIAPVFYVAALFYAGLGMLNPLEPDLDFFAWSMLYLYFLYFCLYSIHPNKRVRWVLAIAIYLSQSIVVIIFPKVEGYMGWLLFLFLVGRFLGIHHPGVIDDRPLSPTRKIVGWLAIVVFILCFSPKPFIFEETNVVQKPNIEQKNNSKDDESDQSKVTALRSE
ncbi:MAG: site-2 protease family protein [bacterium]|nr:site-2 protease family protein [bacterium]